MADDKPGIAGPIIKVGLMALGGLAALSIAFAMLKPLLILGVLAGAGLIGYRLFVGTEKALDSAANHKVLGADNEFERKMRELDAIDKKLDAEINRHS